MKDKWLSHFKDGPTNSTRTYSKVFLCRVCGKRIPFLYGSRFYCSKECQNKQLALKKAKYRDKKRRG